MLSNRLAIRSFRTVPDKSQANNYKQAVTIRSPDEFGALGNEHVVIVFIEQSGEPINTAKLTG